jgi:MOSC domain-containing protein
MRPILANLAIVQVTRLSIYPVKSLGAVLIDTVTVTPQGLDGDRRYVLLDPDGDRVSAREVNTLLAIQAVLLPGGVRLTASDGQSIEVAQPAADAPHTRTSMSRIDDLALTDPEAGVWLSVRAGRPLRLAYQHDRTVRSVSPSHGGRVGDTMTLQDAGPILLITEASIRQLRAWIGHGWVDHAEAIQRFRPNVVIDGDVPFDEDHWDRIQLGDTWFRVGAACDRCVMTTIDLSTLTTTKEPIRTLAKYRAWDGNTWFGVLLLPELQGDAVSHLAVGDRVSV